MDNELLAKALKLVMQIGAGAVLILPLLATWAITKRVNDVAGKIGVKLPGAGLAEKAQKKANEFGDRQKKREDYNALMGNSKIPFRGGARRRAYRRELKGQELDSRIKSAQAQFGVTDEKAAELVMNNARNNAQAAATQHGSQASFVHGVANNPQMLTQGMGDAKDNPFVLDALRSQQEKAIADAISDVQLSAKIGPGEVSKMADQLKEAIASGDSIKARAMQNLLLKSGSPGIDAYRKTIADAEATNPGFTGNDTHTALRQNIVSNHSDIKAKSNDLMKQATKGGSLLSHSQDAKTWDLTDDEMAGQKKTALTFAAATGAISVKQANEVLTNPELSKKLDKETRQIFEDVRSGAPPPSMPVI